MPTNIFIAFASQDRDVRDKLLRQMNLVKDRQGWNIWSAKEIKAGERWDDEIKRRLVDSEVVVLLLSTDFFNSDYIIEKELPEVIAKHKRGECQIIPVLARHCHWKDTVFGDYVTLGDIQALPAGERPIVSRGAWDSEDEPYLETVAGIKDSIRAFQAIKREKAAAADGAADLAAEAHSIEAYQTYLAQYPQGEMAREARFHINEEKRKVTTPSPLHRYAAISGGALALLAMWLLTKLYCAWVTKSGLEMVIVQGGTFMMGSPANEADRSDDECQHKVTVASYSIGKYEVTQADWREIMGSDPPELSFKGCDNCPVEGVSWNDVQDFLKKLNAKYPGKNYRLPLEVEWEFAARGGAQSRGYKKYAGSNDLGSVAWYDANSGAKTHTVGSKSPNELGLYDMSGNVSEWCQDTCHSYPCDGKNTIDCEARVIRGGDWEGYISGCRAAARNEDQADGFGGDVGFRLASDPLK